ncbi:MAG: amidase [Alphaproteobacteria bacterium]|nr:amidase [Alphaproteobacteria bacterium]
MTRWALAIITAGLFACAPAPDDSASNGDADKRSQSYMPHGWPARTLPEIAEALQAGDATSEDIISAYLKRIERIDRAGPTLQSILILNPNVLEEAREADAKRATGELLGPLHGVPILLKDNIETKGNMATTAGALALKDNVTGRDSPLVAGFRDAGAIILGKTNLSQWANFRSNDSMSGWSALGGQVRNPHMLDRNPCGSSSGSAVAVAASLAAGAVGTETNGSIICPSNVNGVVGFKPTVGLVSQQYIVPISSSQDTAGPMTKTVKGAAMMLNAMATGNAKADYVAGLNANSLEGARIGVLRFAQGSNADVLRLFNAALIELEAAGATLVDIEEFEPQVAEGASRTVLLYEFKATLNDYLAEAASAVETRTLDELIAFNNANADIELALFDQSIFDAAAAVGGLDEDDYITALASVQAATRENGIDAILADNDVDILVSPSGIIATRVDPINGDVWPEWAGAGWIAAIAGYPHVSIPMGAVHSLPIGISFIGAKGEDTAVLSYGYAYEQRTHIRAEPQYLQDAEERPEIARAMLRRE